MARRRKFASCAITHATHERLRRRSFEKGVAIHVIAERLLSAGLDCEDEIEARAATKEGPQCSKP